jgi:hypothetical protein
VPEYMLYVAYGLFAAGVLACLAFVARNFEDEEPESQTKQSTRRPDLKRSHK